MSWKCW